MRKIDINSLNSPNEILYDATSLYEYKEMLINVIWRSAVVPLNENLNNGLIENATAFIRISKTLLDWQKNHLRKSISNDCAKTRDENMNMFRKHKLLQKLRQIRRTFGKFSSLRENLLKIVRHRTMTGYIILVSYAYYR